jgi:hypothetical protein
VTGLALRERSGFYHHLAAIAQPTGDGVTVSRENTTTRARLARLASFALADAPAGTVISPLPEPAVEPETLHVLTSIAEIRSASETVAASGQRLISILTPDLEPELYDQPAFLEVIKRFVLARSFAKVRVLLRDQARLSNSGSGNRFVAMARRLTSCLEIRIRAPQFREHHCAYCIADDRAIVYRLRADRWDGIAGFNNPPIARQYLQEFDAMWQASAEDRDLRVGQR